MSADEILQVFIRSLKYLLEIPGIVFYGCTFLEKSNQTFAPFCFTFIYFHLEKMVHASRDFC